MINLEAARTYPVLGRFDDYKDVPFGKSFVVDPETWQVLIHNPPNRINEIAKGPVMDLLVMENPYGHKKIILPISSEEEAINLNLDDFLGHVHLTLMQIAEEKVTLESSNESFSDFFSEDSGSAKFSIEPGEVLGFGETLSIKVDPSGGSSWLQFSNTEQKGFGFEVALEDKVVINVGSDLHKLVMRGISDPYTKHWINLSFVRSAFETALGWTVMNQDAVIDEIPEWEARLREEIGNFTELIVDDQLDIAAIQRMALSLLETESIKPVFNELMRMTGDE
mgnify:CR=1 FL=1